MRAIFIRVAVGTSVRVVAQGKAVVELAGTATKLTGMVMMVAAGVLGAVMGVAVVVAPGNFMRVDAILLMVAPLMVPTPRLTPAAAPMARARVQVVGRRGGGILQASLMTQQLGRKEAQLMRAAGITWAVAVGVAMMAALVAAAVPCPAKAARAVMRGIGIPTVVGTTMGRADITCPDLALGTAEAVGALRPQTRMLAVVGQLPVLMVPAAAVALVLVLGSALQVTTARVVVGVLMRIGPVMESLAKVAVVAMGVQVGATGDFKWFQPLFGQQGGGAADP